ncbi:alpha-galactosidase [Bifidobacterium minimum]|uniref:alpha-galactosidase n=1 Tax=Bifidobacterium minimum TaxID=1693 RepID=UPI0012E0A24B|nr:alpha-galactosidase [Bifidobacterium minimum]
MRHVVNQRFARRDRPVLVNNWEATYFDFDEGRILDIASRAKDIGAELVVLDDGWFGHRDDDTTSLGDWDADRRKLPGGIVSLSSRIHDMGLEFGLWFEPEMINMDSDLHRTHLEWMVPLNRGLTPQRNQYVLDMARPEVVDHLAIRMSRLISAAHIDYIKWDMNRNITEAYSAALDDGRQGEFFHRYIMGVYALYDRLTHEHPDVLFESCASGGGRFDLGMMYYAPQAWLSDDTDAVERALIQYATSYGYPQSTMGAHVSAVPNHETGRVTPLSTRGDVAFFGDLGYELDISTTSAQDLSEMRRQISFYVSHRDVFQRGVLTRLVSPYEGDGNLMAWQVASHDGNTVIVECLRILSRPNPPTCRIRPRGLDCEALYAVSLFDSAAKLADPGADSSSGTYYGDELMNLGILMPQAVDPASGRRDGDFTSRLVLIERCHGDAAQDSDSDSGPALESPSL